MYSRVLVLVVALRPPLGPTLSFPQALRSLTRNRLTASSNKSFKKDFTATRRQYFDNPLDRASVSCACGGTLPRDDIGGLTSCSGASCPL